MFHASGLRLMLNLINLIKTIICKLQKKPLTKIRSKIWLMYTYLPGLIPWLKSVWSTSASQDFVDGLCLKIPVRAGFDYPLVVWSMYAQQRSWDIFILRFAQLLNHNGASREGTLCMLMLNS